MLSACDPRWGAMTSMKKLWIMSVWSSAWMIVWSTIDARNRVRRLPRSRLRLRIVRLPTACLPHS